MERKRPHPADDLDPDYEDVADQQNKRQRQVEHDAKLVTTKKIEAIIRQQFAQELQYKETEVDIIDQRLYKARQKLDRLRACLVGSYYSTVTQATGQKKPGQEPSLSIHPAVKQHLGKAPLGVISDSDTGHDLAATPPTATDVRALPGIREEKGAAGTNRKEQQDISVLQKPKSMTPNVTQSMGHGGRGHFKEKRRIIIGNVSRYILTEKRDAGDRATHKWMVYVRGSKEHPNISSFIKKAWFFLHPSYSPNDLVEVSQEPFHLIRRGWGEFPIRVQLHFVDPRNKRVDVIHHLKLDKTYTGLQTLGAETVVDLELEGEREYSTQSSSGRFPIAGSRQTPAATEAPPMTVKKTKSEVLPSSDHNGKLVAACDISVKKELSDSDMDRVSGSDASSDLSQTSKSSNPSELLKMASSYLVRVKSEPMSPVKDNAQRNGFIASVCSSGSTSTHAMSPNARVEANDLTSCHETPAMPSHGGTVPAKFHANSDTSVLQSIKMEPEDEALLTNPESHTATVVVCATPSLSPPTTRSGTIGISPSATRSGTIGISPSATKSGTIVISSPTTRSSTPSILSPTTWSGTPSISPPTTRCDTPGQSVQVMNDSSVDSETNDCLPHVEPPDVSSYDAPSVGDASLTMIDASLIKSEQTPVDVSLSQNAVGSSQSPGQSLLRPQLLPGRTALPEQLFMRVVDQTGRTYLIPGSVAGAAGVGSGGNQKVKDTGKVVFVKKSSTRLPIVVTPSSRPKPTSIASPRQLDGHPVVMETPSGNKAAATSVLPPSVSSLLHSYSRLTQKPNLPASRSGGAVSLLRPRIPTAAGGVPCTTYQKLANIPLGTVVPSSDITASSASKPRFVTFASTTKQTVVMPQGHTTRAQTAVVTPGVPTAKLYLAKVGNKTVMIRVEPKCKTTKPIDAPRPPGGQCNRRSDGAPHPAKEAAGTKHLSDGKGSAEEAGRATSDRIARFVQGISVADYSCIEELVGAALGHFPPLWIQPLTGVTQSVNQGVRPDIMRSSCSDVLQWNIGKQRATEWLHARLIQRAVKVALDGQTEFKGKMLWTTRQVMMWCRYHGYTPLDIATQRTLQRVSHRHVGPRKFDSYTDCKDLVPLIEGALHSASVEEPDVDVDTVEVNTGKSASHAPSITGVVSSEMVAPSAEVKFIQQMAQQIGVHFGPVELTLEPPQCMYAGVTEILMWTAAMTFTEHLLRAAVCSYYKREPQGDTEVAAVDVYDALTRTECFDFLTNRYMAVMSEDQSLTTTQSCGTAVTLDMT